MDVLVPPQIEARFGSDYLGATGGGNGSYELRYRCPYCEERGKSPDRSGHLYVNTTKLTYFCHRCEVRGSVNLSVKGYTFDKIYTDGEYYKILTGILSKKQVDPIQIVNHIPNLRPRKGTVFYDYLIDRGISEDMMIHYDIRIGSVVSKYKYRLIIPNIVKVDEDGNHVTDMFVARYIKEIPKNDLTGKPMFPKYLNPFGENRGKSVFNLHRIPKGSPIIITEGVFSAMSAGRNAVATYGKYVSDYQLNSILGNRPRRIYVALDPDAKENACMLCNRIAKLSPRTPTYLVELPEEMDPNDLGHDEFMKYLGGSLRYSKSYVKLKKIFK